MPKNSPERIRKKLYEEYEDSLFILVMNDAAEKEGQVFQEEKEKLKNNPDFQPSPAAIQKFSQQVDTHLKKPKAYARKRRVLSAVNRAAIAMLIMLILGSAAMTVEAVRVRALNFVMNAEPEYTSFALKENDKRGEKTVDWHKAYAPTFIPEGYEVNTVSTAELSKSIEFKNKQGSHISYMELSESSQAQLDTENASAIEAININGHEGKLIVKGSLLTIIWPMNDHMFIIRGNMDKDTAVKIAEGVKYID
ncbi:MAG: DUF4367 domain-containing protein [Methanosarcina sp.]|nr:DUF4367 domain-containing protein [Methanosarcina sp.]